jgi:hypothetical protein
MQVSSELCGEVIARAACGISWGSSLGGLDRVSFPLLGALDPYGDAAFNHRQVLAFIDELDRLPAERGGEWVGEARALAELVRTGTHRYLVFVGD